MFSERFISKLVHRVLSRGFLVVNNFSKGTEITLLLLIDFACSQLFHLSFFVNKSVDMNSLSAAKNLLSWSQFIERTELDGGGQQIDVELLKDKPR